MQAPSSSERLAADLERFGKQVSAAVTTGMVKLAPQLREIERLKIKGAQKLVVEFQRHFARKG